MGVHDGSFFSMKILDMEEYFELDIVKWETTLFV